MRRSGIRTEWNASFTPEFGYEGPGDCLLRQKLFTEHGRCITSSASCMWPAKLTPDYRVAGVRNMLQAQ